MEKKSDRSVGIIVGRFQVDELHAGHRFLIETAFMRHRSVLVAVGVSGGLATRRDPLDFETRRRLIMEAYPQATVLPVYDRPSNAAWSRELDRLVTDAFPGMPAVCYGSRDSFLSVYEGKFSKEYVKEVRGFSGTGARVKIGKTAVHTKDFRAGAIYAAHHRLPVSYQAVDVAVVSFDRGNILLGRKKQDGDKLRFIGGFVDPTDESLEHAARREAYEEAPNIEIADLRYLGSARINDVRYRGSEDGVMSALFVSAYVFGYARAGDDLDALEWVPFRNAQAMLITEHHALWDLLEKQLRRFMHYTIKKRR
ncbi:hypothetical protein A2Z10_00740 [Candidatus Azambacteria bacterium RBG_16_47_10]|uniref:Nudix hydrolase domain-containing protein n=1 Tax=Candidatus Azambacteria bacterium RBG_16_47_10 TaxID=1797292 RepID=A0A1F5B0L7_9BACT|nr:MAG: hypothetical protein A2Z10_00740 [Candidatus Azambacteria bacterium RBG_16_47_10]